MTQKLIVKEVVKQLILWMFHRVKTCMDLAKILKLFTCLQLENHNMVKCRLSNSHGETLRRTLTKLEQMKDRWLDPIYPNHRMDNHSEDRQNNQQHNMTYRSRRPGLKIIMINSTLGSKQVNIEFQRIFWLQIVDPQEGKSSVNLAENQPIKFYELVRTKAKVI
jgi:hypothetical protein